MENNTKKIIGGAAAAVVIVAGGAGIAVHAHTKDAIALNNEQPAQHVQNVEQAPSSKQASKVLKDNKVDVKDTTNTQSSDKENTIGNVTVAQAKANLRNMVIENHMKEQGKIAYKQAFNHIKAVSNYNANESKVQQENTAQPSNTNYVATSQSESVPYQTSVDYSTPVAGYVNIANGYLNFRSGASLSSNIIGHLTRHQPVNIVGTKGNWYKAEVGGQTGWVWSGYINKGTVNSTPVVHHETVSHPSVVSNNQSYTASQPISHDKVSKPSVQQPQHQVQPEHHEDVKPEQPQHHDTVKPEQPQHHQDVKPSVKPEQPQHNQDVKPSVKPEQPEHHQDVKPEQPQHHQDVKPSVKPEQPEHHQDVKPSVKPEQPQQPTKPDVKPVQQQVTKTVLEVETLCNGKEVKGATYCILGTGKYEGQNFTTNGKEMVLTLDSADVTGANLTVLPNGYGFASYTTNKVVSVKDGVRTIKVVTELKVDKANEPQHQVKPEQPQGNKDHNQSQGGKAEHGQSQSGEQGHKTDAKPAQPAKPVVTMVPVTSEIVSNNGTLSLNYM